MNEFSNNGESQTPEEIRREKIRKNVRELSRRKEAEEISESDFGAEGIFYLQKEDRPLTRGEIGNRAVVLSQEQLEQLGWVEIVLPNGETTIIDPEDTGYQANKMKTA